MQPKISVIVPVYNVEKYLFRCIDSLINQSLKDIEIILVNDGSPDGSRAICEKYLLEDKRIKLINKNNEGLGFARNSGLEIATGEFVAFVDSDDYVDLQMYEILYAKAKEMHSDVMYCGFNKVSDKLKVQPINEVSAAISFESHNDVEEVLLDMIGTEPSCKIDNRYQMSVWRGIYSKLIIDQYKIRFCSEREFISEDIIFHIDYLQKASKISFMPDALYFYCDNSDSLTRTYRADRFERYVILYKEICSRLPLIEVQSRAMRLLIAYTRSLIFLLSEYDMTMNQRVKTLKIICNDIVWQKINKEYDYKKLTFLQYLVFCLVKNNCYYSLILLSYIKKLRKAC